MTEPEPAVRLSPSVSNAMAVINLAVDELRKDGFPLSVIVEALHSYTKAAHIAAQAERMPIMKGKSRAANLH